MQPQGKSIGKTDTLIGKAQVNAGVQVAVRAIVSVENQGSVAGNVLVKNGTSVGYEVKRSKGRQLQPKNVSTPTGYTTFIAKFPGGVGDPVEIKKELITMGLIPDPVADAADAVKKHASASDCLQKLELAGAVFTATFKESVKGWSTSNVYFMNAVTAGEDVTNTQIAATITPASGSATALAITPATSPLPAGENWLYINGAKVAPINLVQAHTAVNRYVLPVTNTPGIQYGS